MLLLCFDFVSRERESDTLFTFRLLCYYCSMISSLMILYKILCFQNQRLNRYLPNITKKQNKRAEKKRGRKSGDCFKNLGLYNIGQKNTCCVLSLCMREQSLRKKQSIWTRLIVGKGWLLLKIYKLGLEKGQGLFW